MVHMMVLYGYLRIAYVVIAVFFIVSYFSAPYPLDFVVKAAPAALAAVVAFLFARRGAWSAVLAAAFLSCAAGDVFLGISRTRLFMPALVSFLVAHILLAIVFCREAVWEKFRLPRMVPPLAYAALVAVIVVPRAERLAVPVAIYIAAIAAMAAFAALRRGPGSMLCYAGSLSFMVGDSLIAFDKIVASIPGVLPVILCFYYTAVFGICFGVAPKPSGSARASTDQPHPG